MTEQELQAKIIEGLRKEKDQLLSEIAERSNCFNENVVLEKEVECLREAFGRKSKVHDALNRDYVKLREENKGLREALQFYADIEKYQRIFQANMFSRIDLDAGHVAAKALAGDSDAI